MSQTDHFSQESFFFHTQVKSGYCGGAPCFSYEKPKANSYPVSTLFAPSLSPQASPISVLPGEDHSSKTLIRASLAN